jgi:hypothetical protein
MSQTGTSSSRSRLLTIPWQTTPGGEVEYPAMNLDADPADAVECAALTWLVEHGKQPNHVEWCDGRHQWHWWREWCDVTRHTLPDVLYRRLRPPPEQPYTYSWYAFGTYQEAIAAFVAAYAAWQSSGASEPGKGV